MRKFLLSVLCTQLLSLSAFSSTHSSLVKSEISELTYAENLLLEQNLNWGEIIATADSVVALGEKIYTLVQKGKPTSQTSYASINVLPKDPLTKQAVDPFDLEGDAEPVRKKYAIYQNDFYGREIARIEFLLHFTPKRSYEGKGQYIQNAVIIPLKVNASYGWDVSATMEVTGISTKGKKTNPIATATLSLRYKITSVFSETNEAAVFDIDGTGNVVKSQ